MKKKAKREFNLKAFLIATLRRSSYRYPARNEALSRARIERGIYRCESCEKTYPKKLIQLDHKIPIVGADGFTTWDDYISRLYCEASGFSVLCITCHSVKTKAENELRKQMRILKKEQNVKKTKKSID